MHPSKIPNPAMERLLNILCRFLLMFLIPATALLIWHGNITAIEIKDFVVQMTCLAVLCIAIVRVLFLERLRIPKDPLPALVVFYGLIMFIGYLSSNRSSINTRALVPQIYGLIIFLWVVYAFEKKHIRTITALCAITGTVAALYGIAQYLKIDPLHWMIPSYDVRGLMVSFFGQKNYLALFLILMIPMAAAHAISVKHLFWRAALAVCGGLMVTALALSRSRGGLIAFFLAVGMASLIALVIQFSALKTRRRLAVAALLVPVAAGVTFYLLPGSMQKEFFGLGEVAGIRWEYYRASMEIIDRNPITGSGPGSFVTEYPLNKIHRTMTKDPNKVLSHVHSDYLEIGVEYGLLGLVVYLSIIGLYLFRWAGAYRSKDNLIENSNHHLILLCCLTSTLGYLIYSAFTVAGRYMSSTFFFWLTLAVGYLLTDDKNRLHQMIEFDNPIAKRRWLAAVLSLVAVLTVGWGMRSVIRSYRSDMFLKRASVYSSQGRFDPALWYLNRALALRPGSVETFYQRGYVFFQKGQIDRALNDYQTVHAMAPNYVNAAFNTASCYYRKRDWINAIRMAEQSHRLFPEYPPPLLMLANCYYYIRQPHRALDYCNKIIKLDKYPSNRKAKTLKSRLMKILKMKNS